MKHIIDFGKYTTADPFMTPVLESKGIPNILKTFSLKIFKKIDFTNLKNISINFNDTMDIGVNKFIVKNLSIIFFNDKRNDIYAITDFGYSKPDAIVNPTIKISLDKNNFNISELKKVILHELLHIYEIFKRSTSHKTSGDKLDLQWKLSAEISKIRDMFVHDKFINDLVYLIYLSLDHEINARVAETYHVLMELNTTDKNILEQEIKNTSSWKYKNNLNDFNHTKYDINFNNIYLFFRLLNKSLSKMKTNFNLFKVPTDANNCQKIINQWENLFKKKSKYFERKLLKLIDEVINDIKLNKSYYVECNNSIIDSINIFPYVTKCDPVLLRNSKIYKLLR